MSFQHATAVDWLAKDMLVVKIYPSLVHMVVIFCLACGKRGRRGFSFYHLRFCSVQCAMLPFQRAMLMGRTGRWGGEGCSCVIFIWSYLGVRHLETNVLLLMFSQLFLFTPSCIGSHPFCIPRCYILIYFPVISALSLPAVPQSSLF